ncbi:MAG: RING finger protein [Actinomycetota bacterium]|nr:RING finger protein [Actinomycetota bacterium]
MATNGETVVRVKVKVMIWHPALQVLSESTFDIDLVPDGVITDGWAVLTWPEIRDEIAAQAGVAIVSGQSAYDRGEGLPRWDLSIYLGDSFIVPSDIIPVGTDAVTVTLGHDPDDQFWAEDPDGRVHVVNSAGQPIAAGSDGQWHVVEHVEYGDSDSESDSELAPALIWDSGWQEPPARVLDPNAMDDETSVGVAQGLAPEGDEPDLWALMAPAALGELPYGQVRELASELAASVAAGTLTIEGAWAKIVEDDGRCAICLDSVYGSALTGELKIVQTRCWHLFHADCLVQGLTSATPTPQCPTCRADLRQDTSPADPAQRQVRAATSTSDVTASLCTVLIESYTHITQAAGGAAAPAPPDPDPAAPSTLDPADNDDDHELDSAEPAADTDTEEDEPGA